MYVIRVIPLVKLPMNAPAVLDYFWPSALVRGALVRVSMGKRTIAALVVDILDFRTAKLQLKKAAFSLKKIAGVITEAPQLTTAQFELARWISVQYACSLATALKTVAPTFIGKRGSLNDHSSLHTERRTNPASAVLVTQPDTTLSAVRDVLNSPDSRTLVIVPDRHVALSLVAKLGDGIACFHSGMPSAELKAVYRGVLDGTVLHVVGTRSALFLPWPTLSHIIVEDPLNEMYKSDMTPRFNAPDVARHLASLHGASLLWLTAAISTVQHHLSVTGALSVEYRKPHWPAVSLSTVQDERSGSNRSLFSRSAQDAILTAYEQRQPLLVYSARRGYATIARCSQCLSSVVCTTCDIPMRWHRTSEDMLVCYHCGTYIAVPRRCEACHAGILKPSGTPGSQKIAEAVNVVMDRHGFPKMNIPILDSDLVNTPDDSSRTLALLDAMEHPILVATTMVFSHRYDRTFSTVIVPHMDMLAANPDYRTQDRLILQLEKLADFKPERLFLQTYHDDRITPLVQTRSWDAYFTEELEHRKSLRWPPYFRIVKLSFTHSDRMVAMQTASTDAVRLRRAITHLGASGTYVLGPEPALVEKSGGRWTHHLIIKSSLSPSRLSGFLRYVPEGWAIDVDPRSIS